MEESVRPRDSASEDLLDSQNATALRLAVLKPGNGFGFLLGFPDLGVSSGARCVCWCLLFSWGGMCIVLFWGEGSYCGWTISISHLENHMGNHYLLLFAVIARISSIHGINCPICVLSYLFLRGGGETALSTTTHFVCSTCFVGRGGWP